MKFLAFSLGLIFAVLNSYSEENGQGNTHVKVEFYSGEKSKIVTKVSNEKVKQKDNNSEEKNENEEFENLLAKNKCFSDSYKKSQTMILDKMPQILKDLQIEDKFVIDTALFFHMGEKGAAVSKQRVKDVEIKIELRKIGQLLPEARYSITMASPNDCLADGSNFEMTTAVVYSNTKGIFKKYLDREETAPKMGEVKSKGTAIYGHKAAKPLKVFSEKSFNAEKASHKQ